MKKSTLITTIAMIVVVVVALSTATYAWFTSNRTISVDPLDVIAEYGAHALRFSLTLGITFGNDIRYIPYYASFCIVERL